MSVGYMFIIMVLLVGMLSWFTVETSFFGICFILSLFFLFLILKNSYIGFFVLFETGMIFTFFLMFMCGEKPERVLASFFFIVYSMVGSMPLFFVVLSLHTYYGYNFVYSWDSGVSLFFFVCVIMSFVMKLPMFGGHHWLPLAHVEAPLFCSIILAGVLMKFGLFGLFFFLRTGFIYKDSFVVMGVFLGILCVSLVFVFFICMRQMDSKSFMAYSSMLHMGACLLIFVHYNELFTYGASFMSLSHALASSGLFIFVTWLKMGSKTRKVLFGKNQGGMCLMFFLLCLLKSSVPFMPGFFGEVLVSTVLSSMKMYLFVFLMVFLSGVLKCYFFMLLSVRKEFFVFFGSIFSYLSYFCIMMCMFLSFFLGSVI